MNFQRWQKRAHKGKTSHAVFLAKLIEEVGEVGNAMLEKSEQELIEELEHVEHISMCFRMSIRQRQMRRANG